MEFPQEIILFHNKAEKIPQPFISFDEACLVGTEVATIAGSEHISAALSKKVSFGRMRKFQGDAPN